MLTLGLSCHVTTAVILFPIGIPLTCSMLFLKATNTYIPNTAIVSTFRIHGRNAHLEKPHDHSIEGRTDFSHPNTL